MEKNVTVATDQEIASRLPQALPKTNHNPKKANEGHITPKSNSSKLMALQDALQDPVIVYEGG